MSYDDEERTSRSRARDRERDLVLAPNEYAYISDTTKGEVRCFVGPKNHALPDTDKPVVFNKSTKKFERSSLPAAIQVFTTAPEGWYIILKNPAAENTHPRPSCANEMLELNVGRKVNIHGPASFALWPGQMAKVVKGHHLRSNQYLLTKVYDEESATKSWDDQVIKPQTTGVADEGTVTQPRIVEKSDLTMGSLTVIKGTDVSFYMPPTGIEVISGDNTSHVRNAITLERLEYCILKDEDGNKRFLRGPDVVFPKPTEGFVEKKIDGESKNRARKFRAIELNEQMGLYIKIIAPYKDGKQEFKAGDELFITGKDIKIYYPREEHAIMTYGNQQIHYAITIPAGEARYVLDKNKGSVELITGPVMFLPDPRHQVVVQRILESKVVNLWYPKNQEAVEINMKLSEVMQETATASPMRRFLSRERLDKSSSDAQVSHKLEGGGTYSVACAAVSVPGEEAALNFMDAPVAEGFEGDKFDRKTRYTPPRTVNLDTKYEGVPLVNVWTGYAVQVISKTGERRVVVGPKPILMAYDETLEVIELSRGTPKNPDNIKKDVYLRVQNNKVSDIIDAETKDLVKVSVVVSYRVNFEGAPEKWFAVENYVQLMCEHLRSLVRNSIKQIGIEQFYDNPIAVVRNTVLGLSEEGKRPGRIFDENGMRVYDCEILDVKIGNADIANLLVAEQHTSVRQTLNIKQKEKELALTEREQIIQRQIEDIKYQTKSQLIALSIAEDEQESLFNLSALQNTIKHKEAELSAQLEEQERLNKVNDEVLAREAKKREQNLTFEAKELEHELSSIRERGQVWVKKANAIQPPTVAAIQSLADATVAASIAKNMGPLALLGGDSAVDIFQKLVNGTKLEGILKKDDKDICLIEGPETP